MQKNYLNHYFQCEKLIDLNTDLWNRESIERLALKVNLPFKKTYKWLWDKKEREVKKPPGKRAK